MPVAYALAPYVRRDWGGRKLRAVIVNDLTATIAADGGVWSAVEVLGNQAIVKARASAGVLSQINALSGVKPIPLNALTASITTLTSAQRTALRNLLLSAGYTTAEVTARFPNFPLQNDGVTPITLGDVLRFLATRRLTPRYDVATNTIVLDGQAIPCASVDNLDGSV